jgi:hypothetical protein
MFLESSIIFCMKDQKLGDTTSLGIPLVGGLSPGLAIGLMKG